MDAPPPLSDQQSGTAAGAPSAVAAAAGARRRAVRQSRPGLGWGAFSVRGSVAVVLPAVGAAGTRTLPTQFDGTGLTHTPSVRDPIARAWS